MSAETLEEKLAEIWLALRVLQIRVDALWQFADPAGGDAIRRARDEHVDRDIARMTDRQVEDDGKE
jgi:hypothetical protein